MKPQLKWIAALFAVLLTLCGIYQNVWAQTTQAPVIRTYYVYDEGYGVTVVLRLKLLDDGTSEVYGALTDFEKTPPLVYEIKGGFNPDTGDLTGRIDDPPARQPGFITEGTVSGTYLSNSDSFSVIFRYRISGKESFLYIQSVPGHTGTAPILVGIWQWYAADTRERLASAPQFSGEFYILRQFPQANNTFRGIFSGDTLDTPDTIEGQVVPEGVVFRRAGQANNQPFEQRWYGQVAANTESIQGAIESRIGSTWKGEFIAFSFPLQ